MAPFYTGKGDLGDTGFLGKGRVSKSSARIEAVGSVDEASSFIGFARSLIKNEKTQDILFAVQKKLYVLMTELSALPDEDEQFKKVDEDDVKWLEAHINQLEEEIALPREFIIPGDSLANGALDMARTVIRRSERRVIAFLNETNIQRSALVSFLNRLSSLLFILEVAEVSNKSNGGGATLMKEDSE
jgi:cob(I)alamin adenosyltransferase